MKEGIELPVYGESHAWNTKIFVNQEAATLQHTFLALLNSYSIICNMASINGLTLWAELVALSLLLEPCGSEDLELADLILKSWMDLLYCSHTIKPWNARDTAMTRGDAWGEGTVELH